VFVRVISGIALFSGKKKTIHEITRIDTKPNTYSLQSCADS